MPYITNRKDLIGLLETVSAHLEEEGFLARSSVVDDAISMLKEDGSVGHHLLEMIGTVSEYEFMQCASLRQRMFSAKDRALHYLTNRFKKE